MLKSLNPAILIIFLFAFLCGQVQASVIPQSCNDEANSTATGTAQVKINNLDGEECCDIECCKLGCPCSDGLCSVVIYFVSNHGTVNNLLSSDAVNTELIEHPNAVINFLYRPPIYTS